MQTRVVDAGVGDGATAVAAAAGVVMILSEKNVIPASLPASTRVLPERKKWWVVVFSFLIWREN
jgi:hypothetical protein